MGSWTIVIHGHGQHDNEQPNDVEKLQAAFVVELEGAGHVVDLASLTIGSGRYLPSASQPDSNGMF